MLGLHEGRSARGEYLAPGAFLSLPPRSLEWAGSAGAVPRARQRRGGNYSRGSLNRPVAPVEPEQGAGNGVDEPKG